MDNLFNGSPGVVTLLSAREQSANLKCRRLWLHVFLNSDVHPPSLPFHRRQPVYSTARRDHC